MISKIFSDEEYGKVLDTFVIACVDTVIAYRKSVLLVRRQAEPIKHEWWSFGGRMQPGEHLQTTAKRGVYRELGLDVADEGRFIETGVSNLRWKRRREAPYDHGCHHLLISHSIELTKEEKSFTDTLVAKDSDLRWFSEDEILTESFTPELRSILDQTYRALYGTNLAKSSTPHSLKHILKRVITSRRHISPFATIVK